MNSRYEIKYNHPIGNGFNSSVYLTCLKNDCSYATKVIDSTSQEKFFKEIEIGNKAAALGLSPRVVDYFKRDEKHFIVMERIQGITFRKYIWRSPKKDLRIVCGKIVDSIKQLSSAGIVHNDLNSGNIMIVGNDDNLQVKIIDFEKSRMVNVDGADKHNKHDKKRLATFEKCARGANVSKLSLHRNWF